MFLVRQFFAKVVNKIKMPNKYAFITTKNSVFFYENGL